MQQIDDLSAYKNIHLMGIGGAGMSGLAILLDAMGRTVSGCDTAETSYSPRLRSLGIHVSIGHHRDHIDTFSPDLIIYTSAIPQDHPELIEAARRGIPTARRAEVLSLIFNERRGVGIAGTHGKTTTSSMIALAAERAGLMPTVAIGGELSDIGCNAKLGSGPYMVAELDESDGSFELFAPSLVVVTNIDHDHIDHYPEMSDVIAAFERFIDGRKSGAPIVLCNEDTGVRAMLASRTFEDVVTYGLDVTCDWSAADISYPKGGGSRYRLLYKGTPSCDVSLRVGGEHNVLDSLAAIAACELMGISRQDAVNALAVFGGAKRRMQHIGTSSDIVIYDDYGHHPREIQATMTALAKAYPERSMKVIFQPHRYSRTAAMCAPLASVLSHADEVYLLPIYSAGETPISGVSSFLIADEMERACGRTAHICRDLQEAASTVSAAAAPGDLILTIGAGDIEYLSRQILTSISRDDSRRENAPRVDLPEER